jgi:hypothetical protein
MDYKWLVSSLIVAAGIAIGLWQYLETRRKQLLVDLQGDKNAVAAVAMRVRGGRFPRWRTQHRRELFEALCLAAVFQRSGRSRSLVYGALVNAGRGEEYQQVSRYRHEIRETVDRITVIVSQSSAYTDMARARRMLIDLRAALQLDPDIRLRIDTFGLLAHTAWRDWPPDERFRHEAFRWKDVKNTVNRLGRLVLIGPPKGQCPVLALDYHRVAQKPSRETPERPQLTPTGRAVVAAKYHKARDGGGDEVAVAERLAAIIDEHEAYASAKRIAAVPGSHHDFSDELGKDVATRTKREFVLLKARAESAKADPRFTVVDPARVKNETVILVDDVYRQGQTLQACASALVNNGAEAVLGLTATCTISAAAAPCSHDSGIDDALETRPAGAASA